MRAVLIDQSYEELMDSQNVGSAIRNCCAAERFKVYEIADTPEGRLDSRSRGKPSPTLKTSNIREVNPQSSKSFGVPSTKPASRRRSLKTESASEEITLSSAFKAKISSGRVLPAPCLKSKA